jgi:hypothetical protein
MRILLKQNFPLGRFHATPWRAFAFDDPYGEWPPSPWRLLRAILARSFQLSREREDDSDNALREQLVRAFCASKISWRLPAQSWRGPGLQQYQPSEFKKIPAGAADPGEKTYNTTKNKDNFWLAPENEEPLCWILDTKEEDTLLWTENALKHLDDCLARMTYFGRAESITTIERIVDESSDKIEPNCELFGNRTATAVPVLCWRGDATLEQVGATTNVTTVASATTPPGAIWKFAERPTVAKSTPRDKPRKERPPVSILQFAIGGRVFPFVKYWLRITENFRGIILHQIARKHDECGGKFSELPPQIRGEFSLLSGKDEYGKPLTGHQHAAFFLIPDEDGKPSRLICWRKEPFTTEEQHAILAASEKPLKWNFDSDGWKLRLVPLPNETPLPHGKNIFGESAVWKTLTPFVPELHAFARNGKPKSGYEIETQINDALAKLGLPNAEVTIPASQNEPSQWVKIHCPLRERNAQTNDDRRAFHIGLKFKQKIHGPLFLGHSSHFGLGLFAPEE